MVTESAVESDRPPAGPASDAIRRWESVVAWGLGATGVLIAFFVSRGNMAASPDSVMYISAAEALRDGNGVGNWLENPLTTFPPAWPVAIAALSLLGLRPETAAAVLISVALLVTPRLSLAVLRRCTTVPLARVVGMVAVSLSPVLLPWGYLGLSEVPFTALLLGSAAIALLSTQDLHQQAGVAPVSARRRPTYLLWCAVLLGSIAPIIRYAGVAVPVALSVWISMDRRRPARFATAAGSLILGLLPLAAVATRNQLTTDHPFGARLPSSLSPVQVAQQGTATLGRTVLWTIDSAPEILSLVLGVVVMGATVLVTFRAGRSEPDGGRQARLLVGLLAGAQWIVLVAGRSRAEIDNLDGRLLASTAVLVIILAAALLGDLVITRDRAMRIVVIGAAAVWCLIGIAAVGRGIITSADNGYTSDGFERARELSGLESIPEECRRMTVEDIDGTFPPCGVLSNEPWAWYTSDFDPLMTPRRFNDGDDLKRLQDAIDADSDIFIVWTTVNDPYGYLVPIDELRNEFDLDVIDEDEGVTLYRVTGKS